MFGIENFWLFVASGILLNITPGPDMIYVATRSTCQGRSAGVASALAITTGGLIHTLAAVLGLSAVLMYSATAYDIVRYAGAVYLVYMGAKILLSRESQFSDSNAECLTFGRIYRQGLLVSVLNPKVAIFFLAFLPQFANPASPDFSMHLFVLGLCFCFTGCIVMTGIALCFGHVNRWLEARPGMLRWQNRVTGGVFVTMGLGLGLAGGRE